jgi:hypothetical protein
MKQPRGTQELRVATPVGLEARQRSTSVRKNADRV